MHYNTPVDIMIKIIALAAGDITRYIVIDDIRKIEIINNISNASIPSAILSVKHTPYTLKSFSYSLDDLNWLTHTHHKDYISYKHLFL